MPSQRPPSSSAKDGRTRPTSKRTPSSRGCREEHVSATVALSQQNRTPSSATRVGLVDDDSLLLHPPEADTHPIPDPGAPPPPDSLHARRGDCPACDVVSYQIEGAVMCEDLRPDVVTHVHCRSAGVGFLRVHPSTLTTWKGGGEGGWREGGGQPNGAPSATLDSCFHLGVQI